jgi:sialic acid synthase SpsE
VVNLLKIYIIFKGKTHENQKVGSKFMLDKIFKKRRSSVYIAEIGLNHNGSYELASKMIGSAAGAGADAVKFQVFVPEKMNSVYTTSLLERGTDDTPDRSQLDFLGRFVLKGAEYAGLKARADECGVVFFSSVFDEESFQLMESLGAPLYKIASSEVTNHPLIERVAATGKPVIMSTGICTEGEISSAVEIIRDRGGAGPVLMHCVSLYPTSPEFANLSRIRTLADRFGLEVGFSDHTAGTFACSLAAATGARLFEKHFTVDRFHDCPDKDVSLGPEEFSSMIDQVEKAVSMMGDGSISSGSPENGTARAARRSLFAARNIPAGNVIGRDDLIALRPGTGIPVIRMGDVLGKRAALDIKKERIIKLEYLE